MTIKKLNLNGFADVVEIDDGEHPEFIGSRGGGRGAKYDELFRNIVQLYVATPEPRRAHRWLVLRNLTKSEVGGIKAALKKRTDSTGYRLVTSQVANGESFHLSLRVEPAADAAPKGSKK